jgi:hypothetical protein
MRRKPDAPLPIVTMLLVAWAILLAAITVAALIWR